MNAERFKLSKHAASALAAILLAACQVMAADITLHERATTTGALVRLGDVASIDAADPATAARLAQLPLMPAPAPGTQNMVTAQGVRQLLVASGVELNDHRFAGAIRILIGDAPAEPIKPAKPTFLAVEQETPAAQPRPQRRSGFRSVSRAKKATPRAPRTISLNPQQAARLTAELKAELSRFAQQQTGNPLMQALDPELEPRHLSLLSDATTPVDIATTTPVDTGRQRFLISFDAVSGPVRFPVFADVRPARPAVYAVRAVPRGALVTRADVEIRPLPIDARLPAGAVLFESTDEVIGLEATRALRPETVLTDANCLPPMLVRRGDQVSVVAGGGGISIRMSAKAQGNGRRGEIVIVETLDTRERIMARVVARRELAVLSAEPGAVATATRSTRSLR